MEIGDVGEEVVGMYGVQEDIGSWNGRSVHQLCSAAGIGFVPAKLNDNSSNDNSSSSDSSENSSDGGVRGSVSAGGEVNRDGSARADVGVEISNESGTVSGSIRGGVDRDRDGHVNSGVRGDIKFDF